MLTSQLMYCFFVVIQEYINNNQVVTIWRNIFNHHDASFANSVCLAAPNIASKGDGEHSRKASREFQLLLKASHYRGRAQIRYMWEDMAILPMRCCNTCSNSKNVIRGGWICKTCPTFANDYTSNLVHASSYLVNTVVNMH